MKKYLFLGIALIFTLCINAADYNFKVNKAKANSEIVLTLNMSNKTEKVKVGENGVASISLENFKPQYATLQFGYFFCTLYLTPKDKLNISFEGNNLYKTITFSGEGSDINSYINSEERLAPTYYDAKLKEDAYISKVDSMYNANVERLNRCNFSIDFKKQEVERLKFFTYRLMAEYPKFYVYFTNDESYFPSNKILNKIKSIYSFNSDLLRFYEYKHSITNALSLLCSIDTITKYKNDIEKSMIFVDKNISDSKLSEYLENFYTSTYFKSNSLDEADIIINLFKKHVKDNKMVADFDEAYNKWKPLKSGNDSPSFSYLDINGKSVSLNDLKGKYVYIDVWATWCGPCKGQLPHLKKLEEKYAGKDIYFVSISCDRDKKAWETMVKKDDLKGIQLHCGGDNKFMDAYLISGIPRFILLDKEGKIVSATMTRPSNPATALKFDELLK